MVSSTGPPPSTGPRRIPPTQLAAIRDRIACLDSRTKYQEKDRFPAPLGLHELSNAPSLQMAQAGHAPVFQPINGESTGQFQNSPVLATLLFHMPGALVLGQSDPMHSRYISNVVGISADLTTYSSPLSFVMAINGSTIITVNMTSASTGFIAVSGQNPLAPYTDLVTVTTTSIGTGNIGLVVHVELAVNPALPP